MARKLIQAVKRLGIKAWVRTRKSKKPVRVMFMRHGAADYDAPGEPLTATGIASAETAGKAMPIGYTLKGHHSEMLRARQTMEGYIRGAKGRKAYTSTRERKNIGLHRWEINPAAHAALYKRLGALEFSRRWINHDREVVECNYPPEIVADAFIRETRLAKRIHERGAEGILLGKFSHGTYPEVILWRLTGLHFDTATEPRNTACRNNETLELEFNQGKVMLHYRNIHQNVTKRYNQILKTKAVRI